MTDGEVRLWRAWEERRDEAAFERLVRPHLRFLSDFARRAGCGGADADDAVQTALVELAQARGGRPRRVPLRAWLGRSVLQQARMQRRARGRRARHEAAAARPERLDPKPSAHDEVERALSRLDPEARLAVELRYLHDLDYREIAHILKVSEIACRIRVHRAIARLRRGLGPLAPALIAALPLLGGAADARAALARNASARAGTLLGGGLLLATKLKVLAVTLLALAVFLLWRSATGDAQPPARAVADRPAATVGQETTGEAPAPDSASAAPRSEGAPGAAYDEEPPLSPGNGCVRGVIRFEDGEPLRGARVSLWGESKVYATTDEGGRFHLHDDWVAERPVYLSGPNGVNGADPFGFLLGPDVKMVAGDTVRVEIVLERGQRVAARVVSAVTGDPVAEAEISLRRWDGDALKQDAQGGYGYAHTDAAGGFAFDHVVPGDYALTIAAKGFEAQHAHWDLRQRAMPDEFRLEAARRLELRVRNAPPGAVGTRVKWMLDQAPTQGSKDGVPTYRHEIFTLDGEAVMQEGGLLVGDAPPPGEYDLTIWGTTWLPRTERRIVCGSAAIEPVEVALEPGARVEGTLRWPGGAPVAAARVVASGLSRETDGEGRYVFEWMPGAVDGASKEFTVRLDGAAVRLGERTFGQGDPKRVDLVMPGSGTLHFELAGGVEAEEGMIELRRAGEDKAVIERRFRLPLDGPVVLRGLPPDPLRMEIYQFSGSRVRREIRVAGEVLDLGVLKLPLWPRLEIRVRVAEGEARPALVLVSYRDPDAVIRSATVLLDREGRGILPALPPGDRELTVQSGNSRVTVPVVVSPDRREPVEVTLP